MPLTPPPAAPQTDRIRRRDPASEFLLGVANGVAVGGIGATAASFGYSALTRQGPELGLMKNLRGTHLGAVIGGTAALGLINGVVRHAHAGTFNSWAEAREAELKERYLADRAAPGR